MKSWKEEKSRETSQESKALREYEESGNGYKAIYDFAHGVFAIAREDVHNKFDDKYDPDTIRRVMAVAATDVFDFLCLV